MTCEGDEAPTSEHGSEPKEAGVFAATAVKLGPAAVPMLVGAAFGALGQIRPWLVYLFVGFPLAYWWWTAWQSQTVSARFQYSLDVAAWGALLIPLCSAGFAWESYKRTDPERVKAAVMEAIAKPDWSKLDLALKDAEAIDALRDEYNFGRGMLLASPHSGKDPTPFFNSIPANRPLFIPAQRERAAYYGRRFAEQDVARAKIKSVVDTLERSQSGSGLESFLREIVEAPRDLHDALASCRRLETQHSDRLNFKTFRFEINVTATVGGPPPPPAETDLVGLNHIAAAVLLCKHHVIWLSDPQTPERREAIDAITRILDNNPGGGFIRFGFAGFNGALDQVLATHAEARGLPKTDWPGAGAVPSMSVEGKLTVLPPKP